VADEPIGPSLVFVSGEDGPGTHVLLVGIGHYDRLIDGTVEDLDVAQGMGQLDAPPLSVKALADWFLDGNFDNAEKPLASVAMVVSTAEPFPYDHPGRNRGEGPLPDGSVETVLRAIREWLDRASGDRANQTIFYFCGHGVFAGSQVLLCRDYGTDREDRFDRSINFTKFHGAMATKIPEYQIFLADACRTPDEVVDALTSLGGAGRPALGASKLSERGGSPARQSIHLATSDLSPSWGRTDGVSVYADALLRALSGGGAQTDFGMWVGTDGLQSALATYTARLAKGEGVEQEPDRIRSARFKVHRPAKIEVPVYLTCAPTEVWGSSFRIVTRRDGEDPRIDEHDHRAHPDRREFELVLEHDKYTFSAAFDDDSPYAGGSTSLVVHPPEVPLCLPISRRIP
jgi:hypothetical protein